MNSMAIIQLTVGIIFISEVSARIFRETPLTVYYHLCRPFFLRMPMQLAIFITFMETVIGVVLAFNSLLMMLRETV